MLGTIRTIAEEPTPKKPYTKPSVQEVEVEVSLKNAKTYFELASFCQKTPICSIQIGKGCLDTNLSPTAIQFVKNWSERSANKTYELLGLHIDAEYLFARAIRIIVDCEALSPYFTKARNTIFPEVFEKHGERF